MPLVRVVQYSFCQNVLGIRSVKDAIDSIDRWHTSMVVCLKTLGKLAQMLLFGSACICFLIFVWKYGNPALIFVRNRALPLGMDWLHRHGWGRGADSAGPAPFVGGPGDKRTLLPVAPHPVTNPVDLMRRISEDDAEVEAEAEDVVARE